MNANVRHLSPLLAAAASLAAQTNVLLPAHAAVADGHHTVVLPFGTPHFRTQLLLDASAIAPNGAVISGLRFRGDRGFVPLNAASVPNVTVSISHTNVAMGSISHVFATNVTQTPTVVFQGTVTLPGHTALGGGPLPWDIVVAFSSPWQMTTSSGNVLVDIVATNAAITLPHYYLDAVQGGGDATRLGDPGHYPNDDLMLFAWGGGTDDPRGIAPGQTIDFDTVLLFTTPPGVFTLGVQPQPVPIDLGPIGAPTNILYVDPVVIAPLAWSPSPFLYSRYSLPVPNTATLIDALLYGQSALFDASANALGVVLSAAIEVRLGDQAEVLPMQQVDANDPTLLTGVPVIFGNNERGGTPVLIEGVFF